MTISLLLFLIGLLIFIFNPKNVILLFIAIEIMLLSVTLIILHSALMFDDAFGLLFGIYVLILAGAESAIGLSILIAYYRLRGTITLNF